MKDSVNLEIIRKRRNSLHYSLTDMSDALGLTSADQYFRRENGVYQFKARELPALSRKLEIPMEDFFTQNIEKITKEVVK